MLLGFIKSKCSSRGLSVIKNSLTNTDLIARAESGYAQVAAQVQGQCPSFDEAFNAVVSFYEELPWTA